MSTDARENKLDRYLNDPLLRREAGEPWLEGGIRQVLLGSIALRELLLDQIIEVGGFKDASDRLLMTYERQMAEVVELKDKYGVGDPPPRLDK